MIKHAWMATKITAGMVVLVATMLGGIMGLMFLYEHFQPPEWLVVCLIVTGIIWIFIFLHLWANDD